MHPVQLTAFTAHMVGRCMCQSGVSDMVRIQWLCAALATSASPKGLMMNDHSVAGLLDSNNLQNIRKHDG